jgi:outer membrane protein assembly factor BamB
MRRLSLFVLLILFLCSTVRADNWPQWRGPNGDGVSSAKDLPLTWDEKTNVVWKTKLSDDGASTPAIWGDAIFLTCQKGEELLLLRLNRATGKIEWEKTVATGTARRAPLKGKKGDERREQKFHSLHNLASPSPVTDGKVVVVHFGTGDLAAYDFDGKQLWERNLQKENGTYTIWWGHANSPVLYKDLVITACMQDSNADLGDKPVESYLIAHDRTTGEQRWKTLRMTKANAEECDSYTTPVFTEVEGKTQMIVMGGRQLDAYDPATGKQLWFLPGLDGNRTITGPTVANGMVYATCGMKRDLVAVKIGGTGELPASAVVWRTKDNTPDTPCPVAWKDLLFIVSDQGIAQCFDAKSGEVKWKERLTGDFKASPMAADGKVYFQNLAGKCFVVSASEKFEKLAENKLDDDIIASPIALDGMLYLRSRKALYCIGKR